MITRNRTSILVLLLLSLLLQSCWNPFRPRMIDNSNDLIHNRTPLELLQNLERAYRERNINIYKSLLAPDFRFELISSEVNLIGIDVNEDGIRDSWWGFDEDVEFTDNLFNHGSTDGVYPSPDQITLRLMVPPEENWETDPELGHEDWIVIACNFDLTLTYLSSNSSLAAGGVARFYLRPSGNRWYIAIWRDESNL
ncbi:MAG TPA: hypothetical protein PLO35_09365 [Candidatus Cloacimonadota bacterium]|nr:hypothetical protein [Candidatus Cloacimonadota bacterium]